MAILEGRCWRGFRGCGRRGGHRATNFAVYRGSAASGKPSPPPRGRTSPVEDEKERGMGNAFHFRSLGLELMAAAAPGKSLAVP